MEYIETEAKESKSPFSDESTEDDTRISLPKLPPKPKVVKKKSTLKKVGKDTRKQCLISGTYGDNNAKLVYQKYDGIPIVLDLEAVVKDIKPFEKAKRATFNHVKILKADNKAINDDNETVAEAISDSITGWFKQNVMFKTPGKNEEAVATAYCPKYSDEEKILKLNIWNNANTKAYHNGEKMNLEDTINKKAQFKVQVVQCACGLNSYDTSKVTIFPVFKLITNLKVID